jgi:hypothetical protein
MPSQQSEYQFKRARLENGQVEVRIVMPARTMDVDADLLGASARKEMSRWVLSIAYGLGKACGINLLETFYLIYTAIVDSVDQEIIIRAIREKPCTPESLVADPPADVDPEILRVLLADLIDSGTVYVDGHLKCSGDNLN